MLRPSKESVMTPDLSRREALRAGTVASVPLLAGCTGDDDEGETDHPDEGTDSYGVRVMNESELTYTVYLKVVVPETGETPFEETTTVEGQETKTWSSVITGDLEQVLIAELPDRTSSMEYAGGKKKGNWWITPGAEDAPDVRFLDVVLQYKKYNDVGKKRHHLHITHEETDVQG